MANWNVRCSKCGSAPHHCNCNESNKPKCIHGCEIGLGSCAYCNLGERFGYSSNYNSTPQGNNYTPPNNSTPNQSTCFSCSQCNAQTDLSEGWKETINGQPVCFSCKQREREREREREQTSDSDETGLKKWKEKWLENINKDLECYKIDLQELGYEYLALQPSDCIHCVGSPTEQAQWHVNHINKCLTDLMEVTNFAYNLLSKFIRQKGEEFNEKKNKVYEKISQQISDKGLIFYDVEKIVDIKGCWEDIRNCRNSEQLTEREKVWLGTIAGISAKSSTRDHDETDGTKNKRPREEREREDKELDHLRELLKNSKNLAELEASYQTVKNSTLYNSGKKVWWSDSLSYKDKLDREYEHRKLMLSDPSKEVEKWKCPKCGYESSVFLNECYGKCHDEKYQGWGEYLSNYVLLQGSKTLTELENNYQQIKKTPIYNNSEINKVRLDKDYEHYKYILTPFSSDSSSEKAKKDNIQKNFTLEKVKEFFKVKKIRRLDWENGKIKIVYVLGNDEDCENLEISYLDEEDPQFQDLKQHLQDNNKFSLTWEELFDIKHSSNEPKNKSEKPKSNDKGWLIFLIGGIVLLLIVVIFSLGKGKRQFKK